MMKTLKDILSKRITIVVLVITLVVSVISRRLYLYAEDPSGPKDCPPLFPNFAGDPVNPSAHDLQIPGLTLPWMQQGGTINDASCLNQTHVYGIVQVGTEEDLKNALFFAEAKDLKVSISAVRHSMGGHAFYKNALILDMTEFNKMSLDEESKILTVQSGATWHDIQNFLHPRFAVKAMQSSDIFSVGGSISVNAHGMDHHAGSVGSTIRSMRVMLPDGSIQKVSRTENAELFHLVLGGYGLFGIILDVELDITENAIYERGRQLVDYKEFPNIFQSEIGPNEDYGLFYGHLSTAPQSLLQEMILYTYEDTHTDNVDIPPLAEVENIKVRRLVLNLSKQGSAFRYLKWWTEKNVEPRFEGCSVDRNQAMKEGEACFVSRNEPMHDSVKYLYNDLTGETDILHEYFIPRANFVAYIDEMRTILADNDTNLLNTSVRVVHQEEMALNYAPTDMFSIVLYINQKTDSEGNAKMKKLTGELIDLTIKHGGRFFLPYQLYYTTEQLELAYPEIRSFFEAKKQYDPNGLLTNTFYEKYAQAFFSEE